MDSSTLFFGGHEYPAALSDLFTQQISDGSEAGGTYPALFVNVRGYAPVNVSDNGNGTYTYYDDNGTPRLWAPAPPDPLTRALRAAAENSHFDVNAVLALIRSYNAASGYDFTAAQLGAAVPFFAGEHRARFNSGYTEASNYDVIAMRAVADAISIRTNGSAAHDAFVAQMNPRVMQGAIEAQRRWQQTQKAGKSSLTTLLISLAVGAAAAYIGFPGFFSTLTESVWGAVTADAAAAETIAQASLAVSAEADAVALSAVNIANNAAQFVATQSTIAQAASSAAQEAIKQVALTPTPAAVEAHVAAVAEASTQAQALAEAKAAAEAAALHATEAARASLVVQAEADTLARMAVEKAAAEAAQTLTQAGLAVSAEADAVAAQAVLNANTAAASVANVALPATVPAAAVPAVTTTLQAAMGAAGTAAKAASAFTALYSLIGGGGATPTYVRASGTDPNAPQTYGQAAAPYLVDSGTPGVLANITPILSALFLPAVLIGGAYMLSKRGTA